MIYFLTILNWHDVIYQRVNWSNLHLIIHYEITI